MLSESARMTTAEEARFRIDYPNSKPRAIKVVALDAPSELVVKRLAQGQWQRASFLTALDLDGAPRGGEGWTMKAWLSDLAGRTKDLVDEVATADLVVMVAAAGTGAEVAAVIAEACAVRKVMTTALIIDSKSEVGRGAFQDARQPAAACLHAGHRQRRRIHRDHAGGAARLSAALQPAGLPGPSQPNEPARAMSTARRIVIVGAGPAGVGAALGGPAAGPIGRHPPPHRRAVRALREAAAVEGGADRQGQAARGPDRRAGRGRRARDHPQAGGALRRHRPRRAAPW